MSSTGDELLCGRLLTGRRHVTGRRLLCKPWIRDWRNQLSSLGFTLSSNCVHLSKFKEAIPSKHLIKVAQWAKKITTRQPNFIFEFRVAIAAWSSGTGGAGLIGSFSYALLTEPSMGNLQPKVALLIQLFIPMVFMLTYFFLLVTPDDVHTPGWHPKTWLVPVELPSESERGIYENPDVVEKSSVSSKAESSNLRVPQRQLTFTQKIQHILPLLHLMIPLSLVYVGEYLINQGVVLYQLGVFISRSSVKVFELPTWSLFLLPVLQATNFAFFLFEAIYWFTPSIAIIFGLIIFEGLLGGSAYVNTFNKIHKMVSPDVREFSLSVASLGDSIGVNFAGFVAIPLHNFVCKKPMHRY
ncbi:CLN3 protein [Teladorsagia circumcincta]|uniref:Battenin n=1 Tax=Teladorsagia circumcincta TaxID=45464 RepID=A0A2G9V1B5_TELCI|nr:CLN3 protein [Teladorsagia circumcincta]